MPDEWQYRDIPDLSGGLDMSKKPEQIEDSMLLMANNVIFENREVKRDTGYAAFLDNPEIPLSTTARNAITGPALVMDQAQRTHVLKNRSGTIEVLQITEMSLFRRVTNTVPVIDETQWELVRAGDQPATTTNTATFNPSDAQITVADATGIDIGDPIEIIADSGEPHVSIVTGIAALVISIDHPGPSGKGAAIGSRVTVGVPLSGSLLMPVVSVTWVPGAYTDITTSGDDSYMVFTNGIDPPQLYNGTEVDTLGGLTYTAAGNTIIVQSCRSLGIFNNHLFLFNTIEDGDRWPQRVRWSDTNGIETWNHLVGSAGFVDLWDKTDEVQTGSPLGPYLIVYRNRSIIRGEWTGSTTRLFNWNTLVQGTGAVGPNAVSVQEDSHIFMAEDNVYIYEGGYSVTPIGDRIRTIPFTGQGDLDPAYKHLTWMLFVRERREVWISYRKTGTDTDPAPNILLRLDLITGAWAKRDLGKTFPSGSNFELTEGDNTWDAEVGTWDDAGGLTWDGIASSANAPAILLSNDTVPSQVFLYRYSSLDDTDDGVVIVPTVTTKDFFHPRKRMKVNFLDVVASGANIQVDVSFDRGSTWLRVGTVAPGSTVDTTRIHKQFTAKRFRFRFVGASSVTSSFSLHAIGFEFIEDSY